MKISRVYIFLFGVLVICLVGCSREFSKPPEPGMVTGLLIDSELPASSFGNARVRLLECGLSASSQTDGNFAVLAVPNGEYRIRVDATIFTSQGEVSYAGELAQTAYVQGPAVTNLGTLVLDVSGSISGKVFVSDGTPPLNAVVYNVEGDQIASVSYDGSYTLMKVPPGHWKISAARPGYMVSTPYEVDVVSNDQSGLDLQLIPIASGAAAVVSGKVVLGDRKPTAGVSTRLVDRFYSKSYHATTNDNGNFLLENIPSGFYQFMASHPGYNQVGLPNIEVHDGQDQRLPTVILPPEGGGGPRSPTDEDPNGNLDDDGDGVVDSLDNCPVVKNPDQGDHDGDGIGNACDILSPEDDPDGDLILNVLDNCPYVYNPDQGNHDDDLFGDACDSDIDNDGLLNDTGANSDE